MAFLRFSRDKRGVENFYLVQPTTNRRGKVRPRVLYWFRSPPDVKVGREPFDPEVRRALEAQNPDVAFDWRAIVETPIPSADADKWRERRRAERAGDSRPNGAERRRRDTQAPAPPSRRWGRWRPRRQRAAIRIGRRRTRRERTGRARRPEHRTFRRLTVEPRARQRVRVGGAIAFVVLLLWWAGRALAPRLLNIVAHIQSLGPAAPIAFILIYAVAVVALIPASLLTIAGGAVFGLIRGAIYALIGATLGSTAAFLLGRYVARRLVAKRLAAMPRFNAIERAVSAQGRRIVFLLRLSPVVPFNFLNYALGLTTISVWDFVLASLGTVPGAFVYAYAGKVTGEALALAGQAQVPKNASYYAVLLAGLAATVAATTVVTRTARRALQDV